MHNSNLIKIIRKLSAKDIRELRKVVNSPFFNQRKDVIELFEYIVQNIDQSGSVLKKEISFQVLFPDTSYNDSQMRYVMSFLLKNIKQYLSQKVMKQEDIGEQLYLCKALRELGMRNFFEKEWEVAKQKIEKQPLRNSQYYYKKYLLYIELYEFRSQQTRSGEMPLTEIIENLATFFSADILKQGSLALAHKNISANSYDLSLPENIIDQLKDNPLKHPSIVDIYYHTYQSLKSLENEDNFFQLKELITNTNQILPHQEIRDLFLSAINFSIKQVNNDKRLYLNDAFDLYKLGLKRGIFLDNGYLSHFLFKNIMVAGLSLGKNNWVKDFLRNNKSILYLKNRENFYQYCLAEFYYRTGDYDKAMPILQKVDFKDTLNNLSGRRILLRIYYELQEIEALFSLLDSFSVFLRRRKKELGYHIENNSNLIRFTRKMLKTDLKNQETRSALRIEIQNVERVAEKKWLLDQLKK